MRRASLGLLVLLYAVPGQAQSIDAAVSDAGFALPPLGGLDASVLDASIADAGPRDGGAGDGGARDAGAVAKDAGPLDLNLPEQGCRLAHHGDASGALLLALALLSRRRRRA